jgi:O-succinylhomoserine sulfhydrylase
MSKYNDVDWTRYRPATRAVRAGQKRGRESEHSEPIYATSSFVFESAAQAAARFCGDEPGNIYSRFTNPTVQAFEQRLAAMEGGESCVATSSGMAAITALCLAVLNAGDHVVVSRGVFGSTIMLFNNIFRRFGIEIDYVTLTDLDAWRSCLKPNTRMFFFETPGNPLTEVGDIAGISRIAHEHNPETIVVVDNCFCTPVLQRPLDHGADVVMHSATKYIDGQGRCVGGALVGDAGIVGEKIFGVLRTAGPSMSPFNAWVFLKGLETLDIRMQHMSKGALQLARWLEEDCPRVERVYYPGLESHPQKGLADRQQSGAGAVVSFDVKGGRDAAWALTDRTELLSITANLGDTRSTITHPASTTHGRLSEEELKLAGIGQGLLRIAVGLEDIEDIKEDLHF